MRVCFPTTVGHAALTRDAALGFADQTATLDVFDPEKGTRQLGKVRVTAAAVDDLPTQVVLTLAPVTRGLLFHYPETVGMAVPVVAHHDAVMFSFIDRRQVIESANLVAITLTPEQVAEFVPVPVTA